jgi:hypothetical protein
MTNRAAEGIGGRVKFLPLAWAIAQTPTKQPALRLSRTKNLHFAKATFPGFSAAANKAKVFTRIQPCF